MYRGAYGIALVDLLRSQHKRLALMDSGHTLRAAVRHGASHNDKTEHHPSVGMWITWITPLHSGFIVKSWMVLEGGPRVAGTSGISAFPVHCGKFLSLANAYLLRTMYAPGLSGLKGNSHPSPLTFCFCPPFFYLPVAPPPSLSIPPYEYKGELPPQGAPYNFANSMIPTLIRQ